MLSENALNVSATMIGSYFDGYLSKNVLDIY